MVAIADEELSTIIKDQLYWDNRVDASDVGVTVDGGKATLSGTVPSYRAKRSAQEDTWMVRGITEIDNQLKVQYPAAASVPTDSETASNVKTCLMWEPDIDSGKIDVTVTGGVVTLTGTVDTYWKKFLAEEDAYGMSGVIEIVNELTVVPTDRPLDEAIARNIEAALERNINVSADDVTVKVENAVVTLSGVVPDWTAWRAAYNAALYSNGVIDIIDQLAIRY